MTTLSSMTRWIEAYRRAWESNDPADIKALFTEDGEYFTEPFVPPWRGHEEIVQRWLERRDKPGDADFEWSPLVTADEVAIIQGTTTYPDRAYSNLWVIRLAADGRCREFTEWWMDHSIRSDDDL